MPKTQLKNQMSVKVANREEAALIPGGRIRSDQVATMPKNCFVVPMVILEEPEPIKQRRKRR
jgi:hypothetical protein